MLQMCLARQAPSTACAQLRSAKQTLGTTSCSGKPHVLLPLSRRDMHRLVMLGLVAAPCGQAAAVTSTPPPPPTGDCMECIGEVNGTLNACQLSTPSCISIQNNDEAHFAPPWQYDGSREEAVAELVRVVTGGDYTTGLVSEPFGITRMDAAKYIVGATANAISGVPPPPKPQRQKARGYGPAFRGRVADRHVDETGSDYLHVVLEDSPAGVLDVEFLFLTGDNIVDIRAASRSQPSGFSPASLSLSMSAGLTLDANATRREVDRLRKALNWEEAPVLTTFDPRFNMRKAMWFERLYQPFLGSDQKQQFDDEELPLDSYYSEP